MNFISKSKKYNLLIYGCGSIGFRHLEAAIKTNLNLNIFIYDRNFKSYKTISKLINKNFFKNPNTKIKFIRNFNLYKKFNLLILATPTHNRCKIINEIYSKISFKNIVIEKIAFQSMGEFNKVSNLFKQKKINCWINCPRRLHPLYIEVKKLIDKNHLFKMSVNGSNWNFASNLIHFIDLFCFFSNNNSLKIMFSKFGKITRSKRLGYYEFNGRLLIYNKKNDILKVNSNNKKKNPLKIKIQSKNFNIIIDETNKFITFKTGLKNKLLKRNKIEKNKVSDLSTIFIESILTTGKSNLVKSNISYKHHEVMLNIFLNHFNKNFVIKREICPIT